jgi:hypothetical protein
MPKKEMNIFSPEYTEGASSTTSTEVPLIETVGQTYMKNQTQPTNSSDEKIYGSSKPKRVVIRAKIIP